MIQCGMIVSTNYSGVGVVRSEAGRLHAFMADRFIKNEEERLKSGLQVLFSIDEKGAVTTMTPKN